MSFTTAEIRLLRQLRKMQQKDVARRMGISTQRYSILENNENRPLERTNEILRSLSFTESSARTFLDSILLIIKKSDRPF